MSESSLSSMLADVKQLMAAIEEAQNNGDFDSAEQGQDFLEQVIKPALAGKTDAIAYVLQVKLPAVAAERKAYLETVQDWASQPEQQMKSLKAYLKTLWEAGLLDDGQLEGHQHTIQFSTMTRPTITVDQQVAEQEWTAEQQYKFGEQRIEFKVNKANLEAALKQGDKLPLGVDVNYSTKLSIKMKK